MKDLNLELNDAECRELTERFITDANEISGDIVLRAAKRGRNASELMGVVLSRYMIRHELGPNRRFGWYFLDDYAEWLGRHFSDRARGLVTQTDLSISEIAMASGFSSHIHFSTVYRERFGLPPRDDRIEGRVPFEYRAWPMHRKNPPD